MARRLGDHRRGGLYGYGLANWARQDPASIAGASREPPELARIPQTQLLWDGDDKEALFPCFRVDDVSGQLDFGRLPVRTAYGDSSHTGELAGSHLTQGASKSGRGELSGYRGWPFRTQ